MATKKSAVTGSGAKTRPRSVVYAERGIRTGQDFANMMSALMSDLISGDVTPQVGNAVCNAGDKLLKVVGMQHRYGTTREGDRTKILALSTDTVADLPAQTVLRRVKSVKTGRGWEHAADSKSDDK